MERATNIYREIIPRLDQKQPLALATIVAAEGATPQTSGASALFDERGLFQGTLGGGMLEADAQERARHCLKKGQSLFYRFDLQGDDVGAAEPVCGGSVWVLIDGSPSGHREAWRGLEEAFRSRRSGLLVTRIDQRGVEKVEVERFWIDEEAPSGLRGDERPGLPGGKMTEACRKKEPVFVRDVPISIDRKASFFLEPLFPLPCLLIVGAGHIGRAVARLGRRLDFEVTVVDDRPQFVSRERFPEAASLVVGEINRTTRSFPVGSDTYIVIVTRGHSHDAEALRSFIRSPAAYIGMIGSRQKIALMRERFLSEGWATALEWDRVHTPIGLKIGSRTVEEIALSIAAELVQVRSRARESGSGEDR
ncbi:MAG: XdhC family protein [Candidatus Aminicenantales bacterium]